MVVIFSITTKRTVEEFNKQIIENTKWTLCEFKETRSESESVNHSVVSHSWWPHGL